MAARDVTTQNDSPCTRGLVLSLSQQKAEEVKELVGNQFTNIRLLLPRASLMWFVSHCGIILITAHKRSNSSG